MFEAAAVLDNHLDTLPDIFENVGGHDVQEEVLEELHEDEEAGAEEQDTSQPETIAAPSETGMVKTIEKSDIPESHHIQPLHTTYYYDMICNNADKILLCNNLVSADSGV